MKNTNFFYLQYDKINWQNQEKTKLNYFVNYYIIKKIIEKHKDSNIKIFDIGFGIGFFMKMVYHNLSKHYKTMTLAGCEPSEKNYRFYSKKPLCVRKNIVLKTYNKTFQEIDLNEQFDFISCIYVFPHFSFEDLEQVAKKIYSMLNNKGKFILVVANEKYLLNKLKTKKDLFIENNVIEWNNKKYKEVLHYSDIPKIGKIIDYNREELFYRDFFKKYKLNLNIKKDLNDHGFICTVFVFEKQQ